MKNILWIVTFALVPSLVTASVQTEITELWSDFWPTRSCFFHVFSINGWTTKESQSSFCLSQRSKGVILRHSFPLEHMRQTAWRRPKADEASVHKFLSNHPPAAFSVTLSWCNKVWMLHLQDRRVLSHNKWTLPSWASLEVEQPAAAGGQIWVNLPC